LCCVVLCCVVLCCVVLCCVVIRWTSLFKILLCCVVFELALVVHFLLRDGFYIH
jgi:hypothetical protein